MKNEIRLAVMLFLLAAPACKPPADKDDGSGGAGGDGGMAAGGAEQGGGGEGGGGGAPPMTFECPLDNGKPQLAYGGAVPTLGGVLEDDATWTKDNVYLVFGNFSTGPHTLTIEAGTVVCFDDDQTVPVSPPAGAINVDSGGAIRVLGTEEERVVFTQRSLGPVSWRGIDFSYDFLDTTTFQHVDIDRAGRGGAIVSPSEGAAGLDPDPALELVDVHFYSIQNKGLTIGSSSGLSLNSTIHVHQYAADNTDPATQYPVLTMHPLALQELTTEMFQADSPGVPDEARVIQLGESIIPEDAVMHDIGIPYRTYGFWLYGADHLENGGPAANLTIDPGVTLQVGGMIYIGYHQNGAGNIIAIGTQAKPITFTAIRANEGWPGLFFEMRETDTSVTAIDHAVIEYAGSPGLETVYSCQDGSGGVGGMVSLRKPLTGLNYAGPPISHTLFRNPMAGTDGVRAECSTATNCNTLDYTDDALVNTFEGFDSCVPDDSSTGCGQRPMGCP